MKVGLVWYFTVIANCVSIKYVEVNILAFHGNPNANTANAYDYREIRRKDSRKREIFRSIDKRSIRHQRYDEFMADMIIKHSKAVALTIGLSATATIVIIATAVAAGAIIQCSLCYDQFIPESVVL
uniref:Bm1153 n=1 Tax=Brugia malayi TaxID=6279 RepID=A0A0J9XNQ2_BRUMA|nr:Bm1153 [Brugia malayi]